MNGFANEKTPNANRGFREDQQNIVTKIVSQHSEEVKQMCQLNSLLKTSKSALDTIKKLSALLTVIENDTSQAESLAGIGSCMANYCLKALRPEIESGEYYLNSFAASIYLEVNEAA